jgi:Uri superfamily endonuclease
VSVAIRVQVGRLGMFRFPAGTYVYTGRAARGLRARVRRHLRGCHGRTGREASGCTHGRSRRAGTRGTGQDRVPAKFWHIDYLLARREVHVERVVLASPDPGNECAVNQTVRGTAVVAGFGASDCRQRCRAHLRRVAARRVVQ